MWGADKCKYNMRDVQAGIVVIASKQVKPGALYSPLEEALRRLGLIFEFPRRFWEKTAEKALYSADCSTITAQDLTPFQKPVGYYSGCTPV
jgi:hypothetical protein